MSRPNLKALVVMLSLAAVGVFALLLAGPAGGANAATADISMKNIAYNPSNITISVGDTVHWSNNEVSDTPHTATSGTPGAPNGMFNSGDLMPGQSFDFTFTQAGTFNFFCMVHPTLMMGTVTVLANQQASPTMTTTAMPTMPPATATPMSAAVPVATATPMSAAAPASPTMAPPAATGAPTQSAAAAAATATPTVGVAGAAALPSTGTGSRSDGTSSWVLVAMAAAGAVAALGIGASIVTARRRR